MTPDQLYGMMERMAEMSRESAAIWLLLGDARFVRCEAHKATGEMRLRWLALASRIDGYVLNLQGAGGAIT